MKTLIEEIQDNDPSYDPIRLACEKSCTSVDYFEACMDRVICDGYYGPIRNSDWEEQDGREPYTVIEAVKALYEVYICIDSYRETLYAHDPDSDEYFEYDEVTVDSEDIAHEIFSALWNIYGRWPWDLKMYE